MAFGGPARGNALSDTKFSADGTMTRGTNNNCGNGYTPWGTYLTCEGEPEHQRHRPCRWRQRPASAKEVTGLQPLR